MCTIITDPVLISRLPKSSKGTIQRGVANDVYREEIERLYNGTGGSSGKDKKKRSLKEIETFVGDLVRKVAGDKSAKSTLEGTTDLFSWGVDSLMATRIRTALQKVLDEDDYDNDALLTIVGTHCGRKAITWKRCFRASNHHKVRHQSIA